MPRETGTSRCYPGAVWRFPVGKRILEFFMKHILTSQACQVSSHEFQSKVQISVENKGLNDKSITYDNGTEFAEYLEISCTLSITAQSRIPVSSFLNALLFLENDAAWVTSPLSSVSRTEELFQQWPFDDSLSLSLLAAGI